MDKAATDTASPRRALRLLRSNRGRSAHSYSTLGSCAGLNYRNRLIALNVVPALRFYSIHSTAEGWPVERADWTLSQYESKLFNRHHLAQFWRYGKGAVQRAFEAIPAISNPIHSPSTALETQHRDEFITRLVGLESHAVGRSARICSSRLKQPPKSVDKYVDRLVASCACLGQSFFCVRIRSRLD